MVVILDYGMGNTGSILNMVCRAGGKAIITADLEKIEQATAIILPGVGAFDNGMKKLNDSGILEILNKKVLVDKTPFFGVCLGMQLLFKRSEEGVLPCLGWIPGVVNRFKFDQVENKKQLKIPHMGWNVIEPKASDSLYRGLENEGRFYFVHSYHVVCENEDHVLAVANYGYKFVCSVHKENIFGAQFHPEKSHRFGMAVFRNFLKDAKCLEYA